MSVLITALVTAVLVGMIAYSLGRISTLDNPAPSNTSAEAGFALDMQVHHNHGAEMAMIVRDRTDDAEVRLLAYDIALTQNQQSGQLYGWLTQWGLKQAASEPSMTWMTRLRSGGTHVHDGKTNIAHVPGAPMPGLATPAQLEQLSSASGVQAERVFLTLMIAHHKGAIDMAEAVLDRSAHPSVTTFGKAVVSSQVAEITLMNRMLAERS